MTENKSANTSETRKYRGKVRGLLISCLKKKKHLRSNRSPSETTVPGGLKKLDGQGRARREAARRPATKVRVDSQLWAGPMSRPQSQTFSVLPIFTPRALRS